MATVNYTSLLGLALPTTGDLSGTWGSEVNEYISKYVDSAVEGTQTISGSQTAVTLSTANGAALSQAAAGATGSAQYAVINCTGNPASLLTVTVPASSRNYIVINATSTSQSVKIVGTGPTTGVTLAATERAVVAWNGSDFVKVASSLVSGLSGTLGIANGGTGQTTAQTAINALAGATTSGQYLRGNGTNVVMSAIQAADVPTLNQNTTGTASNVTGTVAVANGGTGTTSLTANYALFGNSTSAVNASSLLQISGSYIRPTAYADTVVAAGNTGTALTLTCTNGNVFTATLTGNATITLSSPVATGASSITLILTNDATPSRTVAWAGGSFVFPGGAASLSRTTTANAVDVWVFFTPNGGTTWYGNIAMKNMTA